MPEDEETEEDPEDEAEEVVEAPTILTTATGPALLK